MTIHQIYEKSFYCPNCKQELKRIPPLNLQIEYDKAMELINNLKNENNKLKDEMQRREDYITSCLV